MKNESKGQGPPANPPNEPELFTEIYDKSYQDYKDESMAYTKARNCLFYGHGSTVNTNKGILDGWTKKPNGFQNFKVDVAFK